MVIIGFDPGLTNTGYAVLRKKNNEITMVECGLITVSYTHLTLPTT